MLWIVRQVWREQFILFVFFDLHGGNGLEVIFVNAQNGFNSVNHVAALWNTRVP